MYRWLLSLLLVSALSACGADPEPPKSAVIRPAKLVTVHAASKEREFTFPAVVRAVQSAELTFPIAGQVVEVNVLEGAEIASGATIARLDARDARNNLAQRQAEFDNSESEYQRAARVAAQGAISRSALDAAKTQLDVRRTALDVARKALEDTVIKAPFAGSISRVYVDQYQNVQAKEPIATLQTAATEAIIDVPGSILARAPQLSPQDTRVVLDAAPGVEIPATFFEASGVADTSTQTFEIGFTFEPPPGLLILPGMTASVHTTFVFDGAEDLVAQGVAVPLNAILAEGDARYVWLVDDEMRLHKRSVVLGADVAETVTVTDGLEGGETVVAAGVSFLYEGMTVRAWTPR
ncbi:MAG: efflux RND transporter periplasmic adaptor subunit [Pseudomonadota bacterium]